MINSGITATFFDGNKVSGEFVKVFIEKDGLQIEFKQNRYDSVFINTKNMQQIEFFEESIQIDINSKKNKLYGKLIIKNEEGMESLKKNFHKKKDFSFRDFVKNPEKFPVGLVLGITIPIIFLFIGAFFLIVFNAYRVIPLNADRGLGKIAYSQFINNTEVCSNRELNGILSDIAMRIKPEDYKFDVDITVVKSDIVNAISLPGGKIIFFSGLLSSSESPDEIAGIMAHEMSHVHRRHGLQQIMRMSGVTLIVSLFTGGTFEGLEVFETAAEAGSTLLFLKYSRSFETEADEDATEFLKNSNIDVNGLISFFKRLSDENNLLIQEDDGAPLSAADDEDVANDEEIAGDQDMANDEEITDDQEMLNDEDAISDEDIASSLQSDDDAESSGYDIQSLLLSHVENWISTHPLDEKRIEFLEKFRKENRYSYKPYLKKGVYWKNIKEACN